MFLSLLVSLGSAIPGSQLLARIPGISVLRIPPRVLFLTGMAVASISAWSLNAMLGKNPKYWKRLIRLSLVGWTGFTVAIALGIVMLTHSLPLPFIWGSIASIVVSGWIILGWRVKAGPARYSWMFGIVLLTFIDLINFDSSLIVFKPADQVYQRAAGIGAWLEKQPGLFRVYSPSYSLPQQMAARYNLELADGINPLQLEYYSRFMEQATGVPRDGYSVTLPYYTTGEPSQDNRFYSPDARLLGLLNVGFVISAFPIQANGLDEVARLDKAWVYKNRFQKPRAWIQPSFELEGEIFNPVDSLMWSPNQIHIKASGPGVLVLSEMAYPGWVASIDKSPVRIESVGGLLRGVQLASGIHTISFDYRPASFYAGLVMCFLGIGLGFVRPWYG